MGNKFELKSIVLVALSIVTGLALLGLFIFKGLKHS